MGEVLKPQFTASTQATVNEQWHVCQEGINYSEFVTDEGKTIYGSSVVLKGKEAFKDYIAYLDMLIRVYGKNYPMGNIIRGRHDEFRKAEESTISVDLTSVNL